MTIETCYNHDSAILMAEIAQRISAKSKQKDL